MRRTRILCFVKDDYGVVQGASAHKGERRDLDNVTLHVLLQFCSGNHFLKGIIKGLQIRINLILHVAREETEFFTGFYGRAAEDDFLHFLILQRTHGKGDGGVSLTRTRRTDGEEHVVLSVGLNQATLIFRTRRDGFTSRAVNNHPLLVLLLCLTALNDIKNVFLRELVELHTVSFQQAEEVLKVCHLLFGAHHFDDIIARNDTQFRAKRLQHAQVGIVRPVKNNGVGLFKNKMFFNHTANLSILMIYFY